MAIRSGQLLPLLPRRAERGLGTMTQTLYHPGKALLALLLFLLLGAAAPAGADPGLAFRNDLHTPVLVQGASVVHGMIRRGQPLLIPPGRTAYDPNLPLGNRQITVL